MTQHLLAARAASLVSEMDLAMDVARRALGAEASARDAHETDVILARWLLDTHAVRRRMSAA